MQTVTLSCAGREVVADQPWAQGKQEHNIYGYISSNNSRIEKNRSIRDNKVVIETRNEKYGANKLNY